MTVVGRGRTGRAMGKSKEGEKRRESRERRAEEGVETVGKDDVETLASVMY